MPDKTIAAVVAGHICLDLRADTFENALAMAQKIDPNVTYHAEPNLHTIMEPLTEEVAPEMAKFIETAKTIEGGLSTGGGVSNTGIPLSYLLNGDIALMAKVGEDPIAEAIEKFLREKADQRSNISLKQVPETTSYTIIITPKDGRSMYAHYPGTNDTFGPEDVDMDLVAKAKMFEFSYPPLMKRFYTDTNALGEMFKAVKSVGTTTFLDMHTLEKGKPSGKADWTTILGIASQYIDVFCPSLEEALFLTGLKIEDQNEFGNVLRDVAGYLLELGAKAVMIKCGKDGIYFRSDKSDNIFRDPIDLFAPAYKVENIVDTTAAGDNSIAAFMWAYVNGYPVTHCLKYANAAGHLNVQHKGSIGAFRSCADLLKVLKQPVVELLPRLGTQFRLDSSEVYYGGDR